MVLVVEGRMMGWGDDDTGLISQQLIVASIHGESIYMFIRYIEILWATSNA